MTTQRNTRGEKGSDDKGHCCHFVETAQEGRVDPITAPQHSAVCENAHSDSFVANGDRLWAGELAFATDQRNTRFLKVGGVDAVQTRHIRVTTGLECCPVKRHSACKQAWDTTLRGRTTPSEKPACARLDKAMSANPPAKHHNRGTNMTEKRPAMA